LSNVHCDVVITGCTFDSSENPAIAVDNQQNFISDDNNNYIIKDNIFLGGSALPPVYEYEGVHTTTTDGTTQQGCYAGELNENAELITTLFAEVFLFHVGHISAITEFFVRFTSFKYQGEIPLRYFVYPLAVGLKNSMHVNQDFPIILKLEPNNAQNRPNVKILVRSRKV